MGRVHGLNGWKAPAVLGVADPASLFQVLSLEAESRFVHYLGELSGQGPQVHGGCARAQQNGQPTLVAQGFRAAGQQLFARAVLLGNSR